ncbi:MAG: PQQ-binding-like beta-propeller repeat protein [Pirellulales bacterium]
MIRSWMWIALGVLSASTAMADDWTQWRGPHRDGRSEEKGLLSKWPEGGPRLLWQANDIGGGYSTPSIANGKAYMVASIGTEQEEVIALSVNDGKQIWKQTIGKVGPNQGPQYPGSRSTPTIVGKDLYCLGSDGDLVCLNAESGSKIWSKNLRKEFDGQAGMWAYTESPLIDGDLLICAPGGKKATVVALKRGTGELVWSCPLPDGDAASYSSPMVATIGGTKQYVLFLGKGIVGIQADRGEFLWRYNKTSDVAANIATPIIQGDMVYSAASRVGGALIQAPGKTGEPAEIYFAKTLPSGIGGSVLVDGKLYGSSGPAMTCVEFATGKVLWQDRSIGAAAVCYADGKIYLHGENNELAMIEASDQGYKLLGTCTPPNAPDRGNKKAWTHPVIADGKLYIRDQGSVWCYDIRG